MGDQLSAMRKDYRSGQLVRENLADDPVVQFREWFEQALDAGVPEPNAMVLSTVGESGTPTSRIVLLKDIGSKEFSFFTHYESPKGHHIEKNPNVALLFPWIMAERQVRVEGVATKVSNKASDTYFSSRPAGSRLGAWASRQSRVINTRDELEKSMQQYQRQFSDKIPRPSWWGGYVVKPLLFEFWQGREDRLHDRFRYTLQENGFWNIERLAP